MSALEVVTTFYDSYDAGDKVAFEQTLHPEVEFAPLTREVMYGREAMAHLLRDIEEHFRVYEVSTEQLIEVGAGAVVAGLRRCTRTHREDVRMEDRFAQAFLVRNGLIMRIHSFKTVDEAIKSLELTT